MGLNKKVRAYLLKRITEATKECAEHLPPLKGSGKEPTAKAKKIHALIDGRFGCYQGAVELLVEELASVDFGTLKDSKTKGIEIKKRFVPRLAALVPVAQFDGHDYPIGEVAIALAHGPDYMLRSNGTTGNCMNYCGGYVRPATAKEIAKITDEQLQALIANANMIILS